MIIYQDQDPLLVINEENKLKLVMNFRINKPNLKLIKILKRHWNDPEPNLYHCTGITNDSLTLEYNTFDQTLFKSEYDQIIKCALINMCRVMELFKGEW